MNLTGQITPTSLLQPPSLNGIRRLGCLELRPGEHENALMVEHFELQVGQVDKFQRSRPPPVSTSRGTNRISETSEKGKGGAPLPNKSREIPSPASGASTPVTPSPKAQASQNWSENNEFHWRMLELWPSGSQEVSLPSSSCFSTSSLFLRSECFEVLI